jgi:hypothetical protein
MNNKRDEIKEIIAKLQSIQIQETVLLQRLERLSGTDNSHTFVPPANTQATREFKIGDLVRIKNPKPFQSKKGKVVKIGTNRITIQSTNGSKIVRAPSNLNHID